MGKDDGGGNHLVVDYRLNKLTKLLAWLVGTSFGSGGCGRSQSSALEQEEARGGEYSPGSRRGVVISFLVVTVFCVLSFATLDRPVAHACRSMGSSIREPFRFITIFGLSGWYLVPSLALFILLRFRYRNPAWTGRALFAFLTIAVSGLLVDILKFVLGRYRPAMLFREENLYGFAFFEANFLTTSFPSGHAAVITALALSLDTMFPRFRVLYVLAALMVIASRVITCAHFLSDVVAGAYAALITGIFVKHQFQRSGIRVRYE